MTVTIYADGSLVHGLPGYVFVYEDHNLKCHLQNFNIVVWLDYMLYTVFHVSLGHGFTQYRFP
jgi:hypothetical protein